MFSSSKARLSVSSVSTSSPRKFPTETPLTGVRTFTARLPARSFLPPGSRASGAPPQPPARLAGVGTGDPGKQRERLLPAAPRGVRLPGGQLHVAQVEPRGRLALRVTKLLVHHQRPLVVRDGLLVVAQLAVGVGDAVQGVGGGGAAVRLA